MSLTFALIVVILAAIVVVVVYISGVLAQLTRLPKLIFYLLAGIILGPLGFGLIQDSFILLMDGQLLQAIVGLAVAIIVFEGGYNFNRCFPHERACAPISFRMLMGSILRLSLLGGLITALLMAALFFFVAQLSFEIAVLLGALTMITGPTVINPCIRQIGIKEEVGFALEGEGLVNDALGVIIAAAIFSAILSAYPGNPIGIAVEITFVLGIGVLSGLGVGGGGILISQYIAPRFISRFKYQCDPVNLAQLTRIGMLIAAFSAYALAELFAHEAGIVSVLLAGILIGNRHRFGKHDHEVFDEDQSMEWLKSHVEEGVYAFGSDLTKLAITTVFILLTAVITREHLLSVLVFSPIPFAGIIIVVALIFFVRPVAVMISTLGTSFNFKERLFMSFFGPRGIVIAATGIFIFIKLYTQGIVLPMIPGYIFLIVMSTVVIQAGLAPYTARACGVCTLEYDKKDQL